MDARRLRRIHLGLVAILTIAALGVLSAGLGGSGARGVFAVLLLFLLPGYAITSALFPPPALTFVDRTVMVLGLGVATSIVVGVSLNVTPWGIVPTPYTIILGAVTLFAVAIALLRREPTGDVPVRLFPRVRVGQALMLVVAGLVAVGAVALSRHGAESQARDAKFTALWILPVRGDPGKIEVGLVSHQQAVETYRLTVKQGTQVLREWASIPLQPGRGWTAVVDRGSGSATIRAMLYRGGQSQRRPYRSVHLSSRT